jgi:hypothetical protein
MNDLALLLIGTTAFIVGMIIADILEGKDDE